MLQKEVRAGICVSSHSWVVTSESSRIACAEIAQHSSRVHRIHSATGVDSCTGQTLSNKYSRPLVLPLRVYFLSDFKVLMCFLVGQCYCRIRPACVYKITDMPED